jgi:hypothetical protein
MERVERRRNERPFLRLLPYLIAVFLVLLIEFLFFGTELPLSFLAFAITAILAVAAFLVKPYLAILGLFVIKPLLDMMWGTYTSGGLKGTYIAGVLGPFLWAFGILYFKISPLDYKLGRTMIFWLICCSVPLVLIPLSKGLSLSSIFSAGDVFLRFINGWGFFFLLPFLVKTRRDFNLFLYAWLVSTLIPGLVGFYYLITGNPWGFQITAGWWRLCGPYHDAAAFMTEITPGLPIMLYLASGVKRWWKKALWLISIAAWLVLAFNSYTRSFWISASVILLIWALRGLWFPAAAALLGTIYRWPVIWRRFTTAGLEEIESPYALGGRIGRWEDFWNSFNRSSILDKLLGHSACTSPGVQYWDVHNQYLLTVINSGLLGLLGLIGILLGFFIHLLRIFLFQPYRQREALLGISVLTLTVIQSFTGKFLMVPNNQWFLFGMMGLLINYMGEAHSAPEAR